MRRSEFPYTLVLTHDIDALSLAELPLFGRTLWGFVYRCLLTNARRFVGRGISFSEYVDSIRQVALLPLVRLGVAKDPWREGVQVMLEMERRLGVRSTVFFVPVPGRQGHTVEGKKAPRNRAAFYDLAGVQDLLQVLDSEGWEVGLHGIDSHLGEHVASEEVALLREALPSPQRKLGIRMHWLCLDGIRSWAAFEKAGLAYDSSFGSNVEVGFPDGHTQPFVPDGLDRLVVLPLVMHDVALLGGQHQLADKETAWQRAEQVLALARERRAVVTVLWHNNSFVAPRYWGWLYEKIIGKARADGAVICRAIDAVEAFGQHSAECGERGD